MQMIGFLSPELLHPTLFSIDVRWRLMMLEAVHHGLSHPIFGVAHAVRKVSIVRVFGTNGGLN